MTNGPKLDIVKPGTMDWMVDDGQTLEEVGFIPNPNRLIPNRYYDQNPFKEGELEGKTKIAVFAGGDSDSKKLSLQMAKEAVKNGVQVDFFYAPEWMPTTDNIPNDISNKYHASVENHDTLVNLVQGLASAKKCETSLRKVQNLSEDLKDKKYDDVFVVGTYWNRDLVTIREQGREVTGYFASLVDAAKGDSFFKHFMERYLIESVHKIKTVDSKNRQIIEDRHTGISKKIDYIHEKESPIKGLKVLFLPEFDLRKDMVPRWRAEWPATHLGDFGVKYRIRGALEAQLYRPTKEEIEKNPARFSVEVTTADSNLSLQRVKADIDWADVIIFQRTSNMFSKEVFDYAKSTGKKIGYDIDDLVFGDNAIAAYKKHGISDAINAQMRQADFVTVSTDALLHEAEKTVMRQADFVTASTDALLHESERTRFSRGNIFQLRNRLQLNELAQIRTKPYAKKDGKIRIGWAGGPQHKDKLIELKEAVHQLYDKHGDNLTFVIKGFDPSSQAFEEISSALREGGRNVQIEGCGYTSVKDWTDYYRDLKALNLDIFFAPARKDEEHYGKSELKYLEAAFLGVPIVTPKIGEHELVIQHGINGMLADIDDMNNSMFQCIDTLVENPELRKTIAKNARRHVLREYDVSKSSEELHGILRKVLGK